MEIFAGILSCAVLEGGLNTTDGVNKDRSEGKKMFTLLLYIAVNKSKPATTSQSRK